MNGLNSRSKNVKKNIIGSLIFKAVGVGVSFLLLPITVQYLTELEYGIWVTLFSVMSWVNLLDMGVGLGLRNKLAEAVAKNNPKEIRQYISTGVAALSVVGAAMLLVFYIGLQFVKLQKIYNTTNIAESHLYDITLYTGIFVILTFVLSIINQFYYAYQKAMITGVINIGHNIIMLIIIYLLTLQPEHNLLYFVYSFGIASLSSRLAAIICFFSNNKTLLPSINLVSIKIIKEIVNLGFRFFIIQIACICMFSASNLFITQKIGPEAVRAYDVLFKIFSVVTMIHGIICTPLWNAYTEAWVKKDKKWIKDTIRKLNFFMIPIVLMSLGIYWLLDPIIVIWIRTDVSYPVYMPIGMTLFVIISCWNNIWATFLNGVGMINIQMYASIFASILVIPLSFTLMNYMEAAGMIIAIDACLLLAGIPQMMQTYKLLK